jgi:hypothetical protein
MSDFKEALRSGLVAFRDASRARKEFFETVQAMSLAVGELTDERVGIDAARVETTSVVYPLASMVQRTVEMVTNQLADDQPPDALFAVRVGAERGVRAQLCRIKISPHGYPIEVTMAGKFLHASDRAALESVLMQVLQHPDVAGKIARVAELRGAPGKSESADASLLREVAEESGPSASKQTAEHVTPLLQAVTEPERLRGYRLIGEALQRQEELDPGLRVILRDVVLDAERSYTDRTECLRLLTYAERLDDIVEQLASLWFAEKEMPTAFSTAISGAFDKRAHLPALLRALMDADVPQAEGLPTTNIATHGYRVSQALGSVRDALTHDGSTQVTPETYAAIRALRARYNDVTALGPMLNEIDPLVRVS